MSAAQPSPYLKPEHQLSGQLRAMIDARRKMSPENQVKADAEMERIKAQLKDEALRHMQETGQPVITDPQFEG